HERTVQLAQRGPPARTELELVDMVIYRPRIDAPRRKLFAGIVIVRRPKLSFEKWPHPGLHRREYWPCRIARVRAQDDVANAVCLQTLPENPGQRGDVVQEKLVLRETSIRYPAVGPIEK